MKPLRTENADEVLKFLNDMFDMDKKLGRGLSRQEDEVRRLVLKKYPELGRAPRTSEIAGDLGVREETVTGLLRSLDKKDVLYLGPSGEIGGAYPFRDQSHYEVVLGGGGKKVNAMCAVDALGIPFMFKENATIKSSCTYCGAEVEVRVENGEVTGHHPRGIVVWAGKTCCATKAATSVCNTLTFFCSMDHAENWRSEKSAEGWALTLAEALYVGKKLFEDALR